MSTDPSFENPPSESASAEKAEMQYTPGTSTLTNSRILQVLRNHEAQLLRIEGVEGVGVGQNQIGDYAITVYIRERASRSAFHRLWVDFR